MTTDNTPEPQAGAVNERLALPVPYTLRMHGNGNFTATWEPEVKSSDLPPKVQVTSRTSGRKAIDRLAEALVEAGVIAAPAPAKQAATMDDELREQVADLRFNDDPGFEGTLAANIDPEQFDALLDFITARESAKQAALLAEVEKARDKALRKFHNDHSDGDLAIHDVYRACRQVIMGEGA